MNLRPNYVNDTKFFVVFVGVLLLVSTGLTGCRSTKNVTKKATSTDVRKIEGYLHNSMPFKTMESKVDFKFNPKSGVGATLKGSVKMNKDSCILLSFQFSGLELAKCRIVKDSITLVSRLHKTYAVERLDAFAYKEFLNISVLQDLLTNRIFVPGKVNPDERIIARFDQLRQKDAAGYRWGEDSFILDFLMDKGQYVRLNAFRPEKSESILVNYGQFKDMAFGSFPMQVDVKTDGIKQAFNIQVLYSKPSFDTPTDFKFSIPANYQRLSTTDFVKRFQNML